MDRLASAKYDADISGTGVSGETELIAVVDDIREEQDGPPGAPRLLAVTLWNCDLFVRRPETTDAVCVPLLRDAVRESGLLPGDSVVVTIRKATPQEEAARRERESRWNQPAHTPSTTPPMSPDAVKALVDDATRETRGQG